MWLNIPGFAALIVICSLCGCVVYAEYNGCDPLTTRRIDAADQVPILSFSTSNTLFTTKLWTGHGGWISKAEASCVQGQEFLIRSQVKPMTYKIDSFHYLVWCSALLGWDKDWLP